VLQLVESTPGVTPMNLWSRAKGSWPGGLAALTGAAAGGPGMAATDAMLPKICTALISLKQMGNYSNKEKARKTSVRQLLQMTAAERLAFVNQVWNWAATPRTLTTLAEAMYVPGAVPTEKSTMPSSYCPSPDNPALHRRRAAGPAGEDIWKTLTVGFRVDGTSDADIRRITSNGFTPQVLSEAFMINTRGQDVRGTAAASGTTPRTWSENGDIWNESAVCVSRNLYGATLFPERTTGEGVAGGTTVILWAINCRGLLGFDTEESQYGLADATKRWRPGEKAFGTIPPGRAIGYVRIRRTGGQAGVNSTVAIDPTASWTFLSAWHHSEKATYVSDELDAWRGSRSIPSSMDWVR